MNREPLLLGIIERMKQGIDCTEDESANIKMFLKENFHQFHTGNSLMFKELFDLFPCEYGEAEDEYPEYLKYNML